MCTYANEEAARADVDALRVDWSERIAADGALGDGARELLVSATEVLDAVVDAVVTRSETTESDAPAVVADERSGDPSGLAAGRAAFAHDLDLPALQRVFGHLHDALSGQLLHGSTDPDGMLCPTLAAGTVRRVRRALERPVVEATRGWFDEAGRKLRHDVKTPLQATSLNLELLALESSERGLDTEALDTIQRSLDQVVEVLARAEPAEG